MPWKKTELGVVHFVSTASGPWSHQVSEALQIPTEDLLRLAGLGSVYLNNCRIYHDAEIRADDYLRLHTEPRRYSLMSLKNRVHFEDEDLLILDKPAGLPCHPTVDNAQENVLTQLRNELQCEVLLTHRLDVPTSGLLVFTKNKIAQHRFHLLLQNRAVKKIYEAEVVSPGPDVGFYEHHMIKSEYAPKVIVEMSSENTQNCQMNVLAKHPFEDRTVLKIELLTGRTHQIRAQLAYMGYPIFNDGLYHHFDTQKPDQKIGLRCVQLQFQWKDELKVFQL